MTNALAKLRRHATLPLLTKELVEMAARKRTYLLRVLYATLLFLVFGAMLYSMLDQAGGSPMSVLGQGRELFGMLVALQFVGIYLFLPAMMCSAITTEKERDALQLLLITDLRPWEILFSKFVGRLVPMLTFLLLSLPLLAIVYAFGGLSQGLIGLAIVALTATIFQVGAFCLMVSAWARTTVAAFIGCYIGLAIFYFAPVLVIAFMLIDAQGTQVDEKFVFLFIPFIEFGVLWSDWTWGGGTPSLAISVLYMTPTFISGLVFLVIARIVFVRRALLPPTSFLRGLFKFFDGIFNRANVVTGGVVLVKERTELPQDKPVKWLEIHQRALGQFRYLVRIFVLLEGPVAIVVTMAVALEVGRGDAEAMTAIYFIIWPIAALLVAVQAAGSFAAERRRQTLDVLLTTPMTGKQIVKEKFSALSRLMWVVALPLLTIIVMEAWWEYDSHYARGPIDVGLGRGTTIYLLGSLLCVVIYLPMVAWLSIWISMVIKHPTRAMLTAVGTLVVWCAAPPILLILIYELLWRGGNNDVWETLMWLSPVISVAAIEFNALDEFLFPPWMMVIANFAWYGGITLFFRGLCLTRADRLLGRA